MTWRSEELTERYLARRPEQRLERVIDTWLSGCDSIVDFACGAGIYGPALRRHASLVVGIDHDPRLAEAAAATAAYDHVVNGPVELLGNEPAAFDGAFCSEFLEHVTNESLPAVMAAIESCVASRIVITVPNPRYPHFKADPTHVLDYSVTGFKRMLERSGRFAYRTIAIGFAEEHLVRPLLRLVQPLASRLAVLSPTVLYVGDARRGPAVPSDCHKEPADCQEDTALRLDVAVVVPTRNEAGNVAALLDELDRTGVSSVLFVDDSDDQTAARVMEEAARRETKIDVVARVGEQRVGGLAGAVLAGIETVPAPWTVVMDADLQHPPPVIASLVDAAVATGADLVVASRHNWESINETMTWPRRALSWTAGRAAMRLLPEDLKKVSDPMSGFFLVRTSGLDLDKMSPDGFKILMEILATHPGLKVAEIPYHFGRRHSGASKVTIAEGARFLRHLWNLRRRARAHAGDRA